jgi:hypothetical protein
MTVDHLVPKHRGGEFTWENLVCACPKCNSRKGDRTLDEAEMKVKRKPREPGYFALSFLYHTQRSMPDSVWVKYLPPGIWRLVEVDTPLQSSNNPA